MIARMRLPVHEDAQGSNEGNAAIRPIEKGDDVVVLIPSKMACAPASALAGVFPIVIGLK